MVVIETVLMMRVRMDGMSAVRVHIRKVTLSLWPKCSGAACATWLRLLLLLLLKQLLHGELCTCASASVATAVGSLESGNKLISVGNVIQTAAIVGAGKG